jgi:hypothetical protein
MTTDTPNRYKFSSVASPGKGELERLQDEEQMESNHKDEKTQEYRE